MLGKGGCGAVYHGVAGMVSCVFPTFSHISPNAYNNLSCISSLKHFNPCAIRSVLLETFCPRFFSECFPARLNNSREGSLSIIAVYHVCVDDGEEVAIKFAPVGAQVAHSHERGQVSVAGHASLTIVCTGSSAVLPSFSSPLAIFSGYRIFAQSTRDLGTNASPGCKGAKRCQHIFLPLPP